MNCKNTLRPLAAAVGVALGLMCGQAAAAIPVSSPLWGFEDDDVDFVGTLSCNGTCTWVPDTNGQLDVGDVLIATFEINTAGGQDIPSGEELTGIAAVEILSFSDLDGGGTANDITFKAVDEGLNAVLALAGITGVTGGEAGGGATIAWYHDLSPDYDMSADTVIQGVESCTSLVQCLQQTGDGSVFQVDGFRDPDDFWISLNPQTNTTLIVGTSAAQTAGAGFNAGQSVLVNGTGQNLAANSISEGIIGGLVPPSGPGGDGMVDMLISGVINGGLELGAGLKADGAVATSDAQAVKAIPEPASLALLGIGLAGLGGFLRSRRR